MNCSVRCFENKVPMIRSPIYFWKEKVEISREGSNGGGRVYIHQHSGANGAYWLLQPRHFSTHMEMQITMTWARSIFGFSKKLDMDVLVLGFGKSRAQSRHDTRIPRFSGGRRGERKTWTGNSYVLKKNRTSMATAIRCFRKEEENRTRISWA